MPKADARSPETKKELKASQEYLPMFGEAVREAFTETNRSTNSWAEHIDAFDVEDTDSETDHWDDALNGINPTAFFAIAQRFGESLLPDAPERS